MFCRLQCDLPVCRCNCLTSRQTMVGWGYGKLGLDIFLLLWAIVPFIDNTIRLMFDLSQSQITVFIVYFVISTVMTIDTVYHLKLVYGIHKDNVKLMRKYIVYSKSLWIIMFVLGIVFAIIKCNGALQSMYEWEVNVKALTYLCVMFIGLIFQTIATVLINDEIKKLDNPGYIENETNVDVKPKANSFNFDFTLKLGTSSTDFSNNNVEEIETTCEKAKLPV